MYCIYNGKNLDSGDYRTLSVTIEQPDIKISKYEPISSDGVIVTNKNFGQRKITVKGDISATTLASAETKLDTLNTYLAGEEQDLSFEIAGAVREFTATLSDFTIKKIGCYFEWTAVFLADAFGRATSTTDLTLGTYTTNVTYYPNTITGSYKVKPIFDFTVNQVEPYWLSKYVQFTNPTLNQRIRLTRIWGWYDRIVLNGETKTASLYASTKTVIDACDVTTGWTSTHTLSLEATLMKEGVGCLKNVMAGAHDHVDFIRLNATAIDLSSTTGKVIVPIFIPTPSAGAVASVQLWIGKNATLAADYDYWTKTTQWDGAALATNAWNYVVFDMATAVTGTNGTPNRSLIKSILISIVGTSAAMQLNGALLDYITLQKAGVTATTIDYEGTFPEYGLGTSSILVEDELTSRNITITGTYTKRFL